MSEPETEPLQAAIAIDAAARDLRHATIKRPRLTPVQVDEILSYLSGAAASLSHVYGQLAGILADAKSHQLLGVDELIETDDPNLTIDTARLRDATTFADQLWAILDKARNHTAHVISYANPRRQHRPPP